MWSPTHVQVTVCRVKGLITKGKNGTNDCFVTISLGKEKFQTSVKQKALSDLEWQEECELAIPTQGNTAEIVLTALHQNFIGVDEFLGMVSLPLAHFDVYERPRTKWFPLKSKPGQEGKSKYRGEIEIRVAFTVKSGSLLDLSKKEKHKGSFGQISQAAHSIGGSLMNLGSKDKKGGGIKKLASSMGSKLRLPGKGGEKGGDRVDGRLSRNSSGRYSGKFSGGDPDPGVISEDDDEFRFDELSHKSSGSSLNLAGSSQASGQGSLENLGGGELLRHNSMKRSGSSASTLPNRAIQPSSSSSSLTAAANANSSANGSSKSPQTKDWNQKLFGSKQSKVPSSSSSTSSTASGGGGMSHLKEESEEVTPSVFGVVRPRGSSIGAVASAAAATASAAATNSSSSNVITRGGGGGDGGREGVPSIIIQDSFVIQEPPSPTPTPLPTAKPRNVVVVNNSEPEIKESTAPPSLPTSEPPPKPRHSRTTTTKQVAPAAPVVDHHPTGEESAAAPSSAADADDDGSTLFLPIGPLPVPVLRSSAPRMPEAPPPPISSVSSSYFPVTRNDDDDDDDNFLRSLSNCDPVTVQQQQKVQPLRPAPPVPKPRRVSPIPPPDSEVPPPVAATRKPPQTQVPFNPFGDELEEEERQGEVVAAPALLNPFEDDEDDGGIAPVVSNPFEEEEEEEEEEDEAPVVVVAAAKNPFEESHIVEEAEEEKETKSSRQSIDRKYTAIAALDELTDDELDEEDEDLNEESVCRWLEKAIEEHDQIQEQRHPVVSSSSSNPNVVQLSIIEDDDEEEKREEDVNVCEQSTVDLFNDQTVEISPVLPTQAPVDEKKTTPTQSSRRDRLQSLFSTPTSDSEERPSTGVVRLNWMEDDDQDEDVEEVKDVTSQTSHSQGFGGSGQLTSSLGSPSMPSGESEVVASLPMDTDDSLFPSPDLDAARHRRLSSILPPRVQEPEFTPPPIITSSSSYFPPAAVVVGSGGSLPTPGRAGALTPKVADLSWDNYDMQMMTTPAPASGTLLPSLAEEETGASASSSLAESETSPATRKKRISLAPCLRTLSWAEPPNSLRGGGTSPLTEEEDDDDDDRIKSSQEAAMAAAAAAAATATSNETHRMKMAASFHQRVVVGEDKPVNNNVSRDNHHAPRDSPSSEDRHRIYQGRSREGLISLLEDRDNEIADLKDYIDCLLLRVIDTCPTVLQTPLKANRTPRK